jgi:hypothetical protein
MLALRPVINGCAITSGSLSYQFGEAATKLAIKNLFDAISGARSHHAPVHQTGVLLSSIHLLSTWTPPNDGVLISRPKDLSSQSVEREDGQKHAVQ